MSPATVGASTACRVCVGFHDLVLQVETDSPELIEVFAQRLRGLSEVRDQPLGLVFRYLAADRPSEVLARPEGSARPVYETPRGQVQYFPDTDTLFLDYAADARMLMRPARGDVQIAFRPNPETLWLASHPLFTLALVEMVKRRGLYSVHAACVAWAGRSLLLAGTTGAGKSTLTLALIGHGLDFLGDDMTFLRPDPGGVRVLAFPDEIDITPHTLSMFPNLRDRLTDVGRPGWKKLQLHAGVLDSRAVAWQSEPAVLVFPTITGSEVSSLVSVSALEALLELAPNVILTDRASSQAHLGALSTLIRHCSCYRLLAGNDVESAAQLLQSLLEESAKT